MIRQSLVARETEVIRTLEAIYGMRENFTLIGGYAVNAYSPLPRYSADCDIVIANLQFDGFASSFKTQGYANEGMIYRDEPSKLETWKFIKTIGQDEVSVDLLVGGVRCRQTEAIWKEEEIRKTSRELRVTGVSGSVLSKVASRELLIAMKLHAGRDPDLRDVAMLARGADWDKIRELSARGSAKKLILRLNADIRTLGEKGFEDRLKAAYASKQNERERVRTVLGEVNRLLKEMQESKATE